MNEKILLETINELCSLEILQTRHSTADDLEKIKERINSKEFRIAVVGEFSSGKSTFINALIGKDILSHATDETTAAITYIYNVPKNDKRIGICEIEYYSKNMKTADISELMSYTAAQSGNNVVDTISSVSVYESFLETEYPIVIVDTPGLNGIMDKHRDITIEEVKHAHACIYLLQKKGISESDTDFISILRNYQSRFIFVQNFIDDIHVSEGETVEEKLADNLNIIENNIGKPDLLFDYDICGISALKALAARDMGISKLYDTSKRNIALEERASLWEESRFKEFLDIITDMMYSGKHRDAVLASAQQAVLSIIDSMLPSMLAKQEINKELQKTDKRSAMIERAQREIEYIEKNRKIQREKLSNFVLKLNKDNCIGLKEYAQKELYQIYEYVCTDIDRLITNYDDLDGFEFVHNKKIPQFYSDITSKMVNSQLIPEINRRISLELSHLYDEAVQRVMEYTANVKNVSEGISVTIQNSGIEKFAMNDENWRTRIIGYEKDINSLKEKQNQRKNEIEKSNQSLRQNSEQLKKVQIEKENTILEVQKNIRNLGKMPDVKITQERRERYVDRSGPFRAIVQFFAGQKKEVYYVDVSDDTERRKWQSKYQEYQRQQDFAIKKCNNTVNAIQNQIDELNAKLKTAEVRNKHDADEIRNKELQMKVVRENYEKALKLNKQEFCNAQKKRLKDSFETKLFDKTKDECVLMCIEEHIDSTTQSHLGTIADNVLNFHYDSVEAQLAVLHEIINTGNEQLSEVYMADTLTINKMISIKNKLLGGNENE